MSRTIALCFGQFGPYHHARVAALQRVAHEQGARVVPVQIAGATTTYGWSTERGAGSGESGEKGCEGLLTLCEGTDEAASPLDVFLKARKLFRDEKVDVAFLPSYSPARFFALFAAAKSLGIRTVMMNESHADTEQATGWKRWIKRQIVKRFDAAFVGGQPHKRHFASLGIPAEKIFTGYDAVDNAYFAARADEVRERAKKSFQFSVGSIQQELKSDEVREKEKRGSQWAVGSGQTEKDHRRKDQEAKRLQKAADPSTLNLQHSTAQSVRSAYGLPERYFLSLGRMVEKKNLATLIAAYGRYCDQCRVTSDERNERTNAENCKLKTEHCPPGLVFVGSGELESALREQARKLGLQVIDRTSWTADQSSHRLTRINTDGSERLAADRTEVKATGPLTRAGGEDPQRQTDDCKLTADDSAAQGGAVYFYGFRQIEENAIFYALAEAFVLPSLKEEWGLVVNEAMAAGLPVIVSRTAGCAEDLVPGSGSMEQRAGSLEAKKNSQSAVGGGQSGESAESLNLQPSTLNSLEQRSNGFVFDPTSVDALSEALSRIADQETKGLRDEKTDDLSDMGKRSREIVAKFSCENFAKQALRAAEAAQS